MSTDQSKPSETSQPAQQITKPVKEKDPRRVAAGKRLAAYSKAAKEKIAQRKLDTNTQDNTDTETDTCEPLGVNTMTILTGVGVLTGLVCLYYTYKQDKRSENNRDTHIHEPEPEHTEASQPKRTGTASTSKLRSNERVKKFFRAV